MALFKFDPLQKQLEVSGSNFTVPDFVSFSDSDVKVQGPAEQLHGTQPEKKWFTFRLLPMNTEVENQLGSKVPSFVKIQPAPEVKAQSSEVKFQPPDVKAQSPEVKAQPSEVQVQPSAEDPQPCQTPDRNTRMCASPESGIDCDDSMTVDDFTSPSISGTKSRTEEDCSGIFKTSSAIAQPENISEQMEIESDYSTKDMETQEPILQILSVHSLAPHEESTGEAHEGIQAFETTQATDNTEVTETVIPQKQSNTEVTETVPQKLNFNSPLPNCARLYLRRIRGINRMLKTVLVLEADYSRAVPLPQSIKNSPSQISNVAKCLNSAKKIKSEPSKEDLHMSRTVKSVREECVKPQKFDPGQHKTHQTYMNNDSPEDGDTTDSDVEDVVEIKKPSPKSATALRCAPNRRKYKPRIAATTITPAIAPSYKPDRIAQLREKLKQKEAALEEIRKNMNAIDKM